MFKSIHLINVQAHKNTFIEFDKGVNAIVGLSDNGKTTIIRAINQLITNRPIGEDYISHWATENSTTIVLDNGVSITRGRDKVGNYYKLDEQVFRAFKQEVPAEIATALNMSEINMKLQDDLPFLLSAGSGEVAQTLNKIVQLDVIDRSISNIHSKKISTERDLKITKNRIADLTEQLKEFLNLEKMETDISIFEQLTRAKQQITERIKRLENILTQINDKRNRLDAFSQIQIAEEALKTISNLLNDKKCIEIKINNLDSLLGQIENKQKQLIQYKSIERAETLLETILTMQRKRREQGQIKIRALQSILDNIRSKENNLSTINKELRILDAEYHKLFPDICPLCAREIKK